MTGRNSAVVQLKHIYWNLNRKLLAQTSEARLVFLVASPMADSLNKTYKYKQIND